MKKTCKTCICWGQLKSLKFHKNWGFCEKANKETKSGNKCIEYTYNNSIMEWKKK